MNLSILCQPILTLMTYFFYYLLAISPVSPPVEVEVGSTVIAKGAASGPGTKIPSETASNITEIRDNTVTDKVAETVADRPAMKVVEKESVAALLQPANKVAVTVAGKVAGKVAVTAVRTGIKTGVRKEISTTAGKENDQVVGTAFSGSGSGSGSGSIVGEESTVTVTATQPASAPTSSSAASSSSAAAPKAKQAIPISQLRKAKKLDVAGEMAKAKVQWTDQARELEPGMESHL